MMEAAMSVMRIMKAMRASFCALMLLVTASCSTDHWLIPAYGEALLRRPDAALGAIIWSHGKGHSEAYGTPLPEYLALLQQAGWDLYRADRRLSGDALVPSSVHLLEYAKDLRSRGYKKI